MPVVAILPAAALVIGATFGIATPLPPACWLAVLILAWLASIPAYLSRASLLTLCACLLGFAAAAAALAQRATREALDPPIVAQSAPYRVDTAGNAAVPLLLEAQIVGDAAATEFGAAFTADVRRIRLPLAPAGQLAVDPQQDDADAERRHVDPDSHSRDPQSRSRDPQSRGHDAQSRSRDPHSRSRDADQRQWLEWRRTAGRIRMTVSGTHVREHLADWRAGRYIRAPVLLNAPLPFRNFGTVDQEQRLALAGIRLFGSIKSATLVEVIAPAPWWQEASASARDYVRRAVAQYIGRWDARSAAIVTAILIGDRAGLDAQTESRLQRAGTYHVIAISGGNIAILVTLVTALLRLAGASPRLRAALAIIVVATYAVIVGSGASVARATLGAIVYLLAHALDHRSAAINILGVAAGVIIVLAPLEAIDPAFWLTCVATLAILVCAERIQTRLLDAIRRRASNPPSPPSLPSPPSSPGVPTVPTPSMLPSLSRVLRWLQPAIALFAATVAAESWLLPITAYAFSQMTLAGLALNFAAIPLMAIAQITGLIVLATAAMTWLTPLAWAAGYVSHVAAYALVESARLADIVPHAAMRLAPPPLWLVVATEVLGITCWLLTDRRRRLACLAAWGCAILTIASAPRWPISASPTALTAIHAADRPPCAAPAVQTTPTAKWLRITALDVAQGDATLIRFPATSESATGETSNTHEPGETLMVDAGGAVTGTYDIGARIVSPALWALGLRRLQTLALTHGDRDHVGGAAAILTDFTPREVWEGIAVTGHPLLTALRHQSSGQHALWRTVRLGDHRVLGAVVHLHVWNPPAPEWERRRVRNDDSIVLEITYGRVSIILPGDIGPDVERTLAAAAPFAPVASSAAPPMLRILKAPHHGSGRSSTATFLNALAPAVTIISAGRGNSFGHPAPATLDRYRRQGTDIFRTDQDGAIQLDTDGRDVFITTCSGRTLHLTAPPAP